MNQMDAVMPAEAAGQFVDPFAYFPGDASLIAGLGGKMTGHVPGYVFHTLYVPVARGPAKFTLRFEGLSAERGTLALRIHVLPLDQSSHPRLVDSERVPLQRLVHQGGEVSMAFESSRGMSYAVLGQIFDATDAAAAALTVVLDQPHDGGPDVVEPVADTSFGASELAATSLMVARDAPSLAAPVSQICTAAQLMEKPFLDGIALAGASRLEKRRLWEQVYLLQALRVYGLLQPGARGLGLGGEYGFLPAAMAAAGAAVVLVGRDAPPELDRLRRPDICDTATFDAGVTAVQADSAALPAELGGFDFAWSCGTASRLGDPTAGIRFIEDAIFCLHPGGVAVHTFDHSPSPDHDPEGAIAFSSSQVERLALALISRQHEVAQLRMVDPAIAGTRRSAVIPGRTSFGMITRRASAGA